MTQQYLAPFHVRQYYGHDRLSRWAAVYETSEPVAVAIHAIAATSQRDPSYAIGDPAPDEYEAVERIWEDPTDAEVETVRALLREYVEQGTVPPPPDEGWCWGETFIHPAV